MKRLFFLLVPVFAVNACQESINPPPIKTQEVKAAGIPLTLSSDSGFVVKKIGLPFLLAHQLADTTESFWENVADHDTIAKYYRVKETSHYFYCSTDLSGDLFETHLLLELTKDGKVIKSERFAHGNYPCCWENYVSGFNRYGDYFGIESCGTGTGYCASYLYLFKELLPQEEQNSIPLNCWSSFGMGKGPQSVSSSMEFKNDMLVMHYKLEEGEFDDDSNFKVRKTSTFDVKFTFDNHTWSTKDSTKFDGLFLN